MRALIRLAVLAVASLSWAGCGSVSHKFRVDALANSRPPEAGATYRLVSGAPHIPTEDTRFQEAAQHVRTALNSRGMVEAPDPATADIEVEVDFGFGASHSVTKESTEPAYAMGTMVNVYGESRTAAAGRSVYLPTDVHEVTRIETQNVSEVFLTLVARETEAGAADGASGPRTLWSVYVTGTQEQPDLELMVPLMVEAAKELIGQNTGERRDVIVHSDQPLPSARRPSPPLVAPAL